jgi:ribose/xylose/arabinose/galactoside ABC-type transport system permease subunit
MIVVTINDGLVLLNISQFWQQVAVGIIIMAAVLLDQTVRGYVNAPKLGGLFRRRRREGAGR